MKKQGVHEGKLHVTSHSNNEWPQYDSTLTPKYGHIYCKKPKTETFNSGIHKLMSGFTVAMSGSH